MMFRFNKEGIRSYRNTHARANLQSFRVTLHDTDIVCGKARDEERTEVQLNSGGWQTATTKKRMNEVADELGLNYRVYQEQGRWYVDAVFPGSGTVRYPFEDRMVFTTYRKHQ